MSAAPGTIIEVAEQSGDWMRVLMGNEASAWMICKAQGMSLLRPARREHYIMDPAVRQTAVAWPPEHFLIPCTRRMLAVRKGLSLILLSSFPHTHTQTSPCQIFSPACSVCDIDVRTTLCYAPTTTASELCEARGLTLLRHKWSEIRPLVTHRFFVFLCFSLYGSATLSKCCLFLSLVEARTRTYVKPCYCGTPWKTTRSILDTWMYSQLVLQASLSVATLFLCDTTLASSS